MGKIRIKTLGLEELEKQQQAKALARRQTKKQKKAQVKGVGLKGGDRIAVVEGTELKPEAKALLEQPLTPPKATKKKVKAKLRSKRYQQLLSLIDKKKLYPLTDAIKLVKSTSNTHFISTIDVHINLKPETTKDNALSGTVKLPYGTGKKRIIAIADESVLAKIESGKIDFDILVAHPSMMPKLVKHAKILGPKGLMPNPKRDTISETPEKRAKELASGETAWKTEPNNPLMHQAVGKASFTDSQLKENIHALIKSIGVPKIAKLTLSSTMGPGIKVDLASI